MKADEITKPGYYWCRYHNGDWEIERAVETARGMEIVNGDAYRYEDEGTLPLTSFDQRDEFTGPLEPTA